MSQLIKVSSRKWLVLLVFYGIYLRVESGKMKDIEGGWRLITLREREDGVVDDDDQISCLAYGHGKALISSIILVDWVTSSNRRKKNSICLIYFVQLIEMNLFIDGLSAIFVDDEFFLFLFFIFLDGQFHFQQLHLSNQYFPVRAGQTEEVKLS